MRVAWAGRIDAPGIADTRRWHQVVGPPAPGAAPGVALLGLSSDEGVRRNLGRTGADEGPAALRMAMGSLPVVEGQPPLYDAGDVACLDADLERAQAEFAARIAGLLDAGHLALGLGGGHEIAYASYRGLATHVRAGTRVGIVNFDAHLDLRDHARADSGTSFLQAIRHAAAAGIDLRYCCVGASVAANTPGLFAVARTLGVEVMGEEDVANGDGGACAARLRTWLDGLDAIHLSICLDVLPQSIAPGVSAPNAGGVPLRTIEALLDVVLDSGRTRVIDIAELSPPRDRDHATARIAARLAHRLVRGAARTARVQRDERLPA